MQYSVQGLNCDDPAIKDMLMDIGTEELSHPEVVGTRARMHLKPMKVSREAAEADPLIAIAGGGGVTLCNSMGNPWTADYLKVTGELDVDLRSNIAAEARAKISIEFGSIGYNPNHELPFHSSWPDRKDVRTGHQRTFFNLLCTGSTRTE